MSRADGEYSPERLSQSLEDAQNWFDQQYLAMPKCYIEDSVILERHPRLLNLLKKKLVAKFPLSELVIEQLYSKRRVSPFSNHQVEKTTPKSQRTPDSPSKPAQSKSGACAPEEKKGNKRSGGLFGGGKFKK